MLSAVPSRFARITAALGVLQSLAWICLSFACIFVYNWEPSMSEEPQTYTKYIMKIIFEKYLSDENNSGNTFVIRPKDFIIFMWFHFILSILWLAFSLDQYNAVHNNKNRKGLIMILWGSLTLGISILDVILTILLGRDYSCCTYDPLSTTTSDVELENIGCFISTGIIMTLAARGFTLWIFNVVASLIVLWSGIMHQRDNSMPLSQLLFETHSIPRAHVSKNNPSSNRNTIMADYNQSPTLPAALNNRNQNIYF